MSRTYTIRELSREFAITTRAIRFYEDKQLLSPKREGQARIYDRADRTRLKLILRGKRLGWPLDEIKRLIDLYDTPSGEGERQQLQQMVERLQSTRRQLISQMQDLEESLQEIEELENNCMMQLAEFDDQGDGQQNAPERKNTAVVS